MNGNKPHTLRRVPRSPDTQAAMQAQGRMAGQRRAFDAQNRRMQGGGAAQNSPEWFDEYDRMVARVRSQAVTPSQRRRGGLSR